MKIGICGQNLQKIDIFQNSISKSLNMHCLLPKLKQCSKPTLNVLVRTDPSKSKKMRFNIIFKRLTLGLK